MQFETNTFYSGLVWVLCTDYKTYGDRAVKHEKWPISSFGKSVRLSVTMISARDASASGNSCKITFCEPIYGLQEDQASKMLFQVCETCSQHPWARAQAMLDKQYTGRLAHCCTIFLGHLGIYIEIQISISERSSGWAIN